MNRGQYRQVNALTSLMLAVSLLADLDDQLSSPPSDPLSRAYEQSAPVKEAAGGLLRPPIA